VRYSAEPYPACPYCLTKIVDSKAKTDQSAEGEKSLFKEKGSKNKENPAGCHHYLGFLSEREDKQQISDECIVCKALLECMLQKMRA